MLTPPRRAILFVFLSIVGLSEGFQGRLLRSSSSLLRLRGSWGLSGLDSLKVSQSSTSKVQYSESKIKGHNSVSFRS
jgi:hypothetical protein